MKTTTLVPWFGSNRTLAHEVGALLKGCRWVGVPFAGGMSELAEITAPTIVVSDLHRHVINLARTVADRGDALRDKLHNLPFHPDILRDAQERCRMWEEGAHLGFEINLGAAWCYFVATWMGRSGKSGIDDEFNGGLSVRWNGNGGDSNTRYRSAVESLDAWMKIMRRCNFTVQDCFEFLDRCEDADKHGIYCDPPWIQEGARYKHAFSMEQQERLAERLTQFKKTRVLVRIGVDEAIDRLYPTEKWNRKVANGRTQANGKKPELLLLLKNGDPQQKLLIEDWQ